MSRSNRFITRSLLLTAALVPALAAAGGQAAPAPALPATAPVPAPARSDEQRPLVPATSRSVSPDPLVTVTSNPPDSIVGDYRIDFAALDRDGDRLLDRGEAAANPTLAAEFDAVDRNRDGRLGSGEIDGWVR